MNLAIITLNYNSINNTIRQIDFLTKEGIPNDLIYVVDNDSEDKEQIGAYCKNNQFNFIQSDKNGGYAHGNNIAIKHAIKDGKENFLLLNPDIQINRNCIEDLYNYLINDETLGVIGPRLCQAFDHSIIVSDGGLLFPDEGFRGDHVNWQTPISEASDVPQLNTSIDYVNGSAIMFKKEVLDDVGWMREDFFMYYEESEWCYRIKKQGKWKIGIKTDAIAFQEDSSRGNFYQFYMTRNRIWISRLYNGNTKLIIKEQLKTIKSLIKGREKDFKLAFTLSKAVISGLLKRI